MSRGFYFSDGSGSGSSHSNNRDDSFWESPIYKPFNPPTIQVPTLDRSIFTHHTSDRTAWMIIWKILVMVVVLVLGLMRWAYYCQQKREQQSQELAAQEEEEAVRSAFGNYRQPLAPT